MDPLLLGLIMLSAQLLVIVSVASIAETLARVTDPRLRLTYWRGVALACLALPLSLLVGPEAFGPGVTFLVGVEGVASAPIRAVLPATGKFVWWVLCAGALGRLGWLCAGARRLRQLRQRSRTAVLTLGLEELRSDVAPRAEFRISCEVAQPAGFGLRHPVILLPEGFFAMDLNAQRAVACHELLHVARRDWPWILMEEVARALFWFHPAVWWLVERIQESREQLRRSARHRADPIEACLHDSAVGVCRRWSSPRRRYRVVAEAPSWFPLAAACKGVGYATEASRLDSGSARVCHGRRDCRHRGSVANSAGRLEKLPSMRSKSWTARTQESRCRRSSRR